MHVSSETAHVSTLQTSAPPSTHLFMTNKKDALLANECVTSCCGGEQTVRQLYATGARSVHESGFCCTKRCVCTRKEPDTYLSSDPHMKVTRL